MKIGFGALVLVWLGITIFAPIAGIAFLVLLVVAFLIIGMGKEAWRHVEKATEAKGQRDTYTSIAGRHGVQAADEWKAGQDYRAVGWYPCVGRPGYYNYWDGAKWIHMLTPGSGQRASGAGGPTEARFC